jgi:hypothetical protein
MMCRRLVCPATGSRRARVLLEETCQPTALHLHARREETNDHHLAECPKPYLSQDVTVISMQDDRSCIIELCVQEIDCAASGEIDGAWAGGTMQT